MADPDAQTPTPDELVGKGIDKLVELRPRALRHINSGTGTYAKVIAGWRAQAALMCRRQADYAKNGRLKFGEGAPLVFLAGSEFDTPSELEATPAIGQVTLTRAGGRPGGTIRKGARFRRPTDDVQRLYVDAQYECALSTSVAQGATTVDVPLIASRVGSHANRPLTGSLATELEITDDIFDRAAWTVTSYEAAGGAEAVRDEDIKQYATAFAIGQHGPNDAAALAGALKAGAKHGLAVLDAVVAATVLYIADSSWASSTRWLKFVRQSLYDAKFVGYGCKVTTAAITNTIVNVEVTCKVKSPTFLAETTSIDAAIQKALRSHFDDRPTWNRWKTAALGAIVSRADRRILSCSSVTVKRLDGTLVSEPTEASTTHFMLLDNGVRATYLNPS